MGKYSLPEKKDPTKEIDPIDTEIKEVLSSIDIDKELAELDVMLREIDIRADIRNIVSESDIHSEDHTVFNKRTEQFHVLMDPTTKLLAKDTARDLDISISKYIGYLIQKDYIARHKINKKKSS